MLSVLLLWGILPFYLHFMITGHHECGKRELTPDNQELRARTPAFLLIGLVKLRVSSAIRQAIQDLLFIISGPWEVIKWMILFFVYS